MCLVSLGCAKALIDSEKALAQLGLGGFALCQNQEDADLVVINGCCFVQDAKDESLEALFDAVAFKEHGTCQAVVVIGCLAERYGAELAQSIPQVDAWVGLRQLPRLAEICDCVLSGNEWPARPDEGHGPAQCTSEEVRYRLTPRHYAYLRLAEGCDNCCAYCAIPSIRGPFVSKPFDAVLREAQVLAEDGAVELNLVAQDTTQYGTDLYGTRRLAELLAHLSEVDGVRWIRLLYAHPAHFDRALLPEIARNDKVCKYIDLPIQHINDKILERMGRGVGRKEIETLTQDARDVIPGVALRSSVIVGFPGETEDDFHELLDFVEQVRFEGLGAFCYSREEGTRAFELDDQVPEDVKQERFEAVMLAQQQIVMEHNRAAVGRARPVLIDEPDPAQPGVWCARSEHEAPEVDGTIFLSDESLEAGTFRMVRITEALGYDLQGELLS